MFVGSCRSEGLKCYRFRKLRGRVCWARGVGGDARCEEHLVIAVILRVASDRPGEEPGDQALVPIRSPSGGVTLGNSFPLSEPQFASGSEEGWTHQMSPGLGGPASSRSAEN